MVWQLPELQAMWAVTTVLCSKRYKGRGTRDEGQLDSYTAEGQRDRDRGTLPFSPYHSVLVHTYLVIPIVTSTFNVVTKQQAPKHPSTQAVTQATGKCLIR